MTETVASTHFIYAEISHINMKLDDIERPTGAHFGRSFEDRFWDKVDKTDGCWNWNGSLVGDRRWYGALLIKTKGKWTHIRAHRLSYLLAHKEIPEGMCVLHSCDNGRCVKPEHLWLGTPQDNMEDMRVKGRISKVSRNRGELCGASKLTEVEVKQIRDRCAVGDKQSKIAKDFGIDQSMVSCIKNKKKWGWLS